MAQRTQLLARWQRLIDRGLDGETLRASELVAVAPLFVDAQGDRDALLAQVRHRAVMAGRLLLGDVDVAAIAAAFPLQALGSLYPQIVAASASAVALVGALFARDAAGAASRLADSLGLEYLVDAGAVAATCVRPPGKPAQITPEVEPVDLLLLSWGLPLIDLLSPYVRDNAESLHRFSLALGLRDHDDDDRYALLPELFARHPELWPERCLQDQQVGILHRAPGCCDVDFARVDRQAVDVRVRNAVTALQRRRVRWRIFFPYVFLAETRALLNAALPADVIVAGASLALAGEGRRIFCPKVLRHAEGHCLLCNRAAGSGLQAVLSREVTLQVCAESLSLPAADRFRDEVLLALAPSAPIVDNAAYSASLAVSLWVQYRDNAAPLTGPPVMLAGPGAEGALARALLKLLAAGDRKRQPWPG